MQTKLRNASEITSKALQTRSFRFKKKILNLAPLFLIPTFSQASLPMASIGATGAAAGIGFAPSEILSALKFEIAKVWLQNVRFKLDGEINNNSPVEVHVLFIDDEGLIKRLGEMDAHEYFANSEQILSDYRSSLEVFSQTIVPGQINDPLFTNPRNVLSKMCVIFAKFSTPGAHRYNVGSDRVIEVELGPLGFTVKTIRA